MSHHQSVLPSSARFQCAPLVEPSTAGERAILYHPETRKAIVLNPSGSRLWTMLATPRSETELATLLREAFPSLSIEQSRADVAAFVQSLLTERLLEIAND